MKSDADYFYGSYSMWVANYQYFEKNNDGTYSLYMIFFIESAINSSGNSIKKNYFRNKDLNIIFTIESPKCKWVSMTESSNGANTSKTQSFGVGVSVGYDGGIVASASASFEVAYTQSYSAVTLTTNKSSSSDGKNHNVEFKYKFLNYTDGKMVAPNTGNVTERMYLLYEIEGLSSPTKQVYTYSVTTEATIFRDKKFPSKNYTMTGSTTFKGNQNLIM